MELRLDDLNGTYAPYDRTRRCSPTTPSRSSVVQIPEIGVPLEPGRRSRKLCKAIADRLFELRLCQGDYVPQVRPGKSSPPYSPPR